MNITIWKPDEENLTLDISGRNVFTTSYDEIGWSGLAAVESVIASFASELDVEVNYVYG